MAWYKREDKEDDLGAEKRSVPVGVFTKCPGCRAALLTADLEKSDQVCPQCDHHFPLSAARRLTLILDPGSFVEEDGFIDSVDPLGFRDSKRYIERLRAAKKNAEVPGGDAVRSGGGTIEGQPVEVGVFVFEFMGGSMGSVVGEKITRVYERALERRVPAIVFSASGGARMQEGVLSLMQMAKISAVLAMLADRRIPYISILTNPTMGGVSASYAMIGDAILAEPGAVIGFAGPRVIKQNLGQELPEGFQTAEFLLDHGMVDCVVHRRTLKRTLSQLLRHMSGNPAAEITA